jgi:hypothetical protein
MSLARHNGSGYMNPAGDEPDVSVVSGRWIMVTMKRVAEFLGAAMMALLFGPGFRLR